MENQFIFTRPLTYELKDNGDLIVSLDISTTEPDLVNDIVTLNFLKSMQRQITERNLKLDIEHESFRGKSVEEKEINKTKVPAGRMLEPSIKEYKNEKRETHHSLNIKGIINKFRQDYENIKGNIMEKFLDAGSIAFIPTRFRKEEKSGIVYRYLDDGILLNTALTGNPINTTAQMRSIISKSIDSLEEYQKAKGTDPGIENRLEVKSKQSDLNKEKQAGEKEEDEKKKKKEEEENPKTKKETKNNSHLSDNLTKLKEVKYMEEDKKAEEVEGTEESETESKPAEAEKPVEEEKSFDFKGGFEKLTKENAELKDGLEKLKAQVSEMNTAISKPVRKSMPETQKKDLAEERKSYPLDLIA